MKNFYSPILIFIVVGVVTFFSRKLGWYDRYWFTDVSLHFLSGVAFGLFWLRLQKKENEFMMLLIGATSFVVLGSVLWEFWEYAGWHITPSHARFYIPKLPDTLSDVLFGLVGGMISSLSVIFGGKRVTTKRI